MPFMNPLPFKDHRVRDRPQSSVEIWQKQFRFDIVPIAMFPDWLKNLNTALKNFVVYQILGVNDTPHRIALGVAVGIFVAWTPTIPFQMLLTVMLAALLGANKVVGVPLVWISNPVTMIPLFGFNFFVGCRMLAVDCSFAHFNLSLRQITTPGLSMAERLHASWQATLEFFWPLWLGSLVIALALALLSYWLTYRAVVRYKSAKSVQMAV